MKLKSGRASVGVNVEVSDEVVVDDVVDVEGADDVVLEDDELDCDVVLDAGALDAGLG